MSSVNKVILVGNLTKDPEVKEFEGGSVTRLRIATNRHWKDSNGERKEDVEYTSLVAWNGLGGICAQILQKGDKIYAEGRLKTSSYVKDDQTFYATEVIMSEMQKLSPKRENSASPSANGHHDDDLPI